MKIKNSGSQPTCATSLPLMNELDRGHPQHYFNICPPMALDENPSLLLSHHQHSYTSRTCPPLLFNSVQFESTAHSCLGTHTFGLWWYLIQWIFCLSVPSSPCLLHLIHISISARTSAGWLWLSSSGKIKTKLQWKVFRSSILIHSR